MGLKYIKGDATAPVGDGPKVIVHCCNDKGLWGAGFVMALSKRWKEPERAYREWWRTKMCGETPFELGRLQLVQVEDNPKLWVANLIGQHDVSKKGGQPPVRYYAIHRGLYMLRNFAQKKGASIHAPRFGAGLAGAAWKHIEAMIRMELVDHEVDVTIYDLPQVTVMSLYFHGVIFGHLCFSTDSSTEAGNFEDKVPYAKLYYFADKGCPVFVRIWSLLETLPERGCYILTVPEILFNKEDIIILDNHSEVHLGLNTDIFGSYWNADWGNGYLVRTMPGFYEMLEHCTRINIKHINCLIRMRRSLFQPTPDWRPKTLNIRDHKR